MVEKILNIGLDDAHGIVDVSHVVKFDPFKIFPMKQTFDGLGRACRKISAIFGKEQNIHEHFFVGRAPDMYPAAIASGAQGVAHDGNRHHLQILNVHTCGHQSGNNRTIDHPGRRRCVPADQNVVVFA